MLRKFTFCKVINSVRKRKNMSSRRKTVPEYDNAGGKHEESNTNKKRCILAIFDCHICSRGKAFASEAKGSDTEVIKKGLSSRPSCR